MGSGRGGIRWFWSAGLVCAAQPAISRNLGGGGPQARVRGCGSGGRSRLDRRRGPVDLEAHVVPRPECSPCALALCKGSLLGGLLVGALPRSEEHTSELQSRFD